MIPSKLERPVIDLRAQDIEEEVRNDTRSKIFWITYSILTIFIIYWTAKYEVEKRMHFMITYIQYFLIKQLLYFLFILYLYILSFKHVIQIQMILYTREILIEQLRNLFVTYK